MAMKRGDIYYADLSPTVGTEQGGTCPVLILRNFPPMVTVAALQAPVRMNTSIQVNLRHSGNGLFRDSVVALDQLRSIDSSRLREYMGRLDSAVMSRVDKTLAAILGLPSLAD